MIVWVPFILLPIDLSSLRQEMVILKFDFKTEHLVSRQSRALELSIVNLITRNGTELFDQQINGEFDTHPLKTESPDLGVLNNEEFSLQTLDGMI